MKKGKRISIKGLGAIISALTIPVAVVFFASSSEAFNSFTKEATMICAQITLGDTDKEGVGANTNSQESGVEVKTVSVVSQGSLWSIEMAPEEIEVSLPANNVEQSSTQVAQQSNELPYPQSIEANSGVIERISFDTYTGAQYINLAQAGQVRNCTSVLNDVLIAESSKLPEFKIAYNSEPQVLIMHTHTTESFEPYTRDFYDASFNSRTTDNTKNVVAVGNEIEEQLKAAGIGVIHDTTVHDYPSYNGSYQRSEITVKNILAQYPSIKIVLDVHRDAIQGDDGIRKAPVATIDGKQAAQIMIISGCDDGTMGMPDFLQNFRFASLVQQQLEGDYPGLTRPILFDYRKYNQHLTTGSILLEMGSHGNSLEEALYSGELMGKALVKALEKIKE